MSFIYSNNKLVSLNGKLLTGPSNSPIRGGTITTDASGNTTHTFYTDGYFYVDTPIDTSSLAVGGGAGSSAGKSADSSSNNTYASGGAGGGSLKENYSLHFEPGVYKINVGKGGKAGYLYIRGEAGQNSSITDLFGQNILLDASGAPAPPNFDYWTEHMRSVGGNSWGFSGGSYTQHTTSPPGYEYEGGGGAGSAQNGGNAEAYNYTGAGGSGTLSLIDSSYYGGGGSGAAVTFTPGAPGAGYYGRGASGAGYPGINGNTGNNGIVKIKYKL